ncbi:MAG: hypothetical protein AAGJ87_14735 [Pseudomonadota bacterium]
MFFARVSVLLIAASMWISAGSTQGFLNTSYRTDIPTLEAVIGHANGDEITTPEETLDYLHALAEAAPDQMTVIPYGESWQGRELVYAVIGSVETMGRLDQIKARSRAPCVR